MWRGKRAFDWCIACINWRFPSWLTGCSSKRANNYSRPCRSFGSTYSTYDHAVRDRTLSITYSFYKRTYLLPTPQFVVCLLLIRRYWCSKKLVCAANAGDDIATVVKEMIANSSISGLASIVRVSISSRQQPEPPTHNAHAIHKNHWAYRRPDCHHEKFAGHHQHGRRPDARPGPPTAQGRTEQALGATNIGVSITPHHSPNQVHCNIISTDTMKCSYVVQFVRRERQFVEWETENWSESRRLFWISSGPWTFLHW